MELTRIPVDADNSADDGSWNDRMDQTTGTEWDGIDLDSRLFWARPGRRQTPATAELHEALTRQRWPLHAMGRPSRDLTHLRAVRLRRERLKGVRIATGRQAPVSISQLRAIRLRRPSAGQVG